MNKQVMILLVSALLGSACTKQGLFNEAPPLQDITMNLSINSVAVNDPMSINQDQTFGSMAIYIYNTDAAYTLEQAALLPSFTATSTKDIPIKTQPGIKQIYVIANYVSKTFKLTNGSAITLSQTTTQQELESIITQSSSSFTPTSLLMVGKQSITLTSAHNGTFIQLVLRRLQARVDVHVYKGASLIDNIVTLQSITLHNQVLNSEVKFDYTPSGAQMLNSPIYNAQTINNTNTLLAYIGNLLHPTDAEATFYTYQNLATSPANATAPYLEVKLGIAGIITLRTYKGYFTDGNQITNKYSLLQNNIYQVIATLDIESKIILNVNVLPWGQTNIEYERPITASDFSFGPFGTSWGGINGKTMNTNVGGIEDAVFQFELKAPIGAAWTATLTNGLDFAFTPTTAATPTSCVSSGFVNTGAPAIIAVRASKKWTGEARDTDFYITVQGNEIPINPIITGTQRRYEGTETRIKIKQVASYN